MRNKLYDLMLQLIYMARHKIKQVCMSNVMIRMSVGRDTVARTAILKRPIGVESNYCIGGQRLDS